MDIPVDNLFKQIGSTIIDKLSREDFSAGFVQSFLGDLIGKYTVKSPKQSNDPRTKNNPSQKATPSQKQDIQAMFAGYKKMYREVLKDSSYINDYKMFLKKVFDKTFLETSESKGPLDLIADEQKPIYVILDGLSKKGADDFKEKLLNDFFKDLKVSFEKSLKNVTGQGTEEKKGLLERLAEIFPDTIMTGGGGKKQKPGQKPRKKPTTRPRGRPRGRGRFPIPLPSFRGPSATKPPKAPATPKPPTPPKPPALPKPAPKPPSAAPSPIKPPALPKPAPKLPPTAPLPPKPPTPPKPSVPPKPASPVPAAPKPPIPPKGAPSLPKAKGMPSIKGGAGMAGGLIGKLLLPLQTAYEAYTNISDSISELGEKESLSTAQKVGSGALALTGGAADILTTFDPTSWGIDKMLGYDIFDEGLLKEALNAIGAKEEGKTMGETLRERSTEMFEAFNASASQGLEGAGLTQKQIEAVLDTNKKESLVDYAKPSAYGLIAPTPASVMDLVGRGMAAYQFAQEPKMATGGIVTEPTRALIGEAGPEAVIPLEKYLDFKNNNIDNEALNKIVSNTEDTNSALKLLSEAMFKLVTVFDKKISSNNNSPIVINNAGQKNDSTSASAAAASNQDPIRRIRMQFSY